MLDSSVAYLMILLVNAFARILKITNIIFRITRRQQTNMSTFNVKICPNFFKNFHEKLYFFKK